MEKEEWLKRYKARLIERGLSETVAHNCTFVANSNPEILDDEPEDAADEEISLWPMIRSPTKGGFKCLVQYDACFLN